MDHTMRRPMLATGILSVALHAAALALVLAWLDPSVQAPRSIAVEIAWVQAGRTGNDSGHPTTPASPAGSPRGSILGSSPRMPPEPWIAGSSPGEDAEKSDENKRPSNTAVANSSSWQEADGQIVVGADLRSAPTRSRDNERLAAARPSSPAFSRKREKEPGRSTSEPSPACGRGQGEGGAACAAVSDSSAVPSPQVAHRQTDEPGLGGSTAAVSNQSGSLDATASAAGAALASDDDIMQRVPPAYPLTARRQGLQGTTIVRARFDAHGRPEEVAVVASSGSASLDDAAREAVRRWRFRAGSAGVLDMPITFRLDGRERGAVAAAGG